MNKTIEKSASEIEGEIYAESIQNDNIRDVSEPDRAIAEIRDVKEVRDVDKVTDIRLIEQDPVIADLYSEENDTMIKEIVFEAVLDTLEETTVKVQFYKDDLSRFEKIKDWCDSSSLAGVIDQEIPVIRNDGEYWFTTEYKESLSLEDHLMIGFFSLFAISIVMIVPAVLIYEIFSLFGYPLIGHGVYLLITSIALILAYIDFRQDMYKDKVEPWDDIGFE